MLAPTVMTYWHRQHLKTKTSKWLFDPCK